MPPIIKNNITSLDGDYLYCGKAYMIDHHANHHPELDTDEYINIQTILDNYDDIKDLSDGGNLKIAFVKKLDKGYAVVVELSKKNNKIILHKTFFYRDATGKRVPYKNKPSILEKWSVDGGTTISPANQQPADTENISALDLSSLDKGSEKSPAGQGKSRKVAGSPTSNEVQAAIAAAETETEYEERLAQRQMKYGYDSRLAEQAVRHDEAVEQAQDDVQNTELEGNRFGLSGQTADNGEHFYQDRNGNINLVDIPQDVFDAIHYKKAPLRLTPSMIAHMIGQHGKETGAVDVDKAIEFILDVMNHFDHVRLGYNGALIFSVENGRDKTGKRAISILLSSKTGDFYGIVSSGYEGVDRLKKRPLLWAGSAIITPATDSATVPVTTLDAQQGGEQIGSASSQSIESSKGKGSEISPTDQEKSRKVAGSGTPNEAQAAVEAAEAKTDTEPTEAQKEAGNYKKGHVKIDGLDITIENPKGSVRSGTDAGGKQWEQEMQNTYGYILGTEGVDGDHIDVYLSDNPTSGNVYVVDQINQRDGSFDEHKVMYGFPSMEAAREAYASQYEDGWKIGLITEVSREEFKKWVNSSRRKTKPFAEYKGVKPLGGTSESEVAVERAIGTEGDVGILESRGVKLQKEDADAEHSATSKEHALREAMVEQLRAAGIDVITDDAEGQRVLDEANEGTRLMGSRTDRKMREVEKFYKGKELDKNTQAVIDVYSGKADNVAIEVERPEGKCRVIMRQGNENKAGTKHSLFRHLDINSGHVTIDELSIIPKVISDGERTENGKKIAYDFVTEDGTRMRVTTEIAVGREVFTNFLSNRRPLKSESRNNTQLSARATDPEVSDTKVGYNSETAKKKGEKVREQKAGKDTIPSVEDFSKKHGVSQKQVSVYAASMQRGSLAGATRAYMEIRREVISRHPEIRNLRALSKTMKPLREELYSAFGNVDELREEIRRRTDEERNAMEAARKREEEKAADERQRMSELESMSDEELDKEYFKALEANDEARVGELVKAAAHRKGYGDTESEYQGVGSWSAPSNPGYETKEERRVEIKNGGTDVNLEDVADGYSPQPNDFFSNLRTYSNDTPHGKESAEAVSNAITALKDGKQATVKVYRAVPSDVKESKMRNGDWVTPSRKYAEMHGDHRLEGKYRIIEQDVPADELWWDGNDINEWGYDDGKSYAYKNTRNNRKSTDAVSYNDNGDVIPLSKRFNDRQDDVRFFRNKDGEVYGFTVGGKIYIDPRKVNAETPLHEYAHLWAEALRKMNPQEWQNVVELMKGTPVWDEVKRKYAELATDDEIADEVIAQYSGRKGAEKMRAEQERAIKEDSDMLDKAAAVAAFERVRKALKGFWKAVADFLHIHYNSAEEVADRVLKDFLDGVNPMSGGKDLASQATGDMNLRFQKEQEKLESESGESEEDKARRLATDEESLITERAKAEGTYMLAPNGEPTNLTERQWVQVRTEAFKAWFGDWENDAENASQVLDENGEPLVVVHWTDGGGFHVFDRRLLGKNTDSNASDEDWARTAHIGFWFNHGGDTDSFERSYGADARRVEAFLNIREPWSYGSLAGLVEDIWAMDEWDEDKWADDGYDGLVVRDEEFGGVSYVAFHPNQIKSATENVGTFSEENGDIRFREEDIETVNARFNEELEMQIAGKLHTSHIYSLGMPGKALQSAGFPDMPIELSSTRLAEKSRQENHVFGISEVKDLVMELNRPWAVFRYGKNAKNVIVGIAHNGKQFLVGVHFNQSHRGMEVSDIRGIFPKDNAEWLNWISQGKADYLDKEKIQALIDKQRISLAEVEYLDLDYIAKIVKEFENPSIPNEKDVKEDVPARDGKGPYPDTEPSEERGRIRRVAEQAAELLHLDNLEILESGEGLEGAKARAKGFYDKKTGKITVIVGNHSSTRDMQQTILHEAVAHYGLRKLFGTHFDTFLDNVYEHTEEPIRKKIAEMAE